MDWTGFEVLGSYVKDRLNELGQIQAKRKEELTRLAACIATELEEKGTASLVFICTHNSRRSHTCHLWAALAASCYSVKGIRFFSGGTEATAFNVQAIKALREAGFIITTRIPGANPVYRVKFPGASAQEKFFSKKYTDPPNPTRDFIAVMTCADADEACPVVYGAAFRHAIRYEDPKISDGTEKEQETYALRCRQISREMFYLISKI
jgi:arsenate reductase